MSKLYTQSEVERAIIEFIKNEYTLSHPNLDKVIATLTPIQLPSDEQIGQEFKHSSDNWEVRQALEIGAKWMRDKIKQGQ